MFIKFLTGSLTLAVFSISCVDRIETEAGASKIFSDLLDAFQTPNAVGDPLLSRGCIYGTSEYGEGWKHSVKEFPVVIAGSAGGRLNGGIHVREAGGNLSRAQLTALRGLGIDVPSFGWNGGQTTDAFDELLS